MHLLLARIKELESLVDHQAPPSALSGNVRAPDVQPPAYSARAVSAMDYGGDGSSITRTATNTEVDSADEHDDES